MYNYRRTLCILNCSQNALQSSTREGNTPQSSKKQFNSKSLKSSSSTFSVLLLLLLSHFQQVICLVRRPQELYNTPYTSQSRSTPLGSIYVDSKRPSSQPCSIHSTTRFRSLSAIRPQLIRPTCP